MGCAVYSSPVLSRLFSGVLQIVLMPVLVPVKLRGYLAEIYRKTQLRYQARIRVSVIRCSNRISYPEAWVSRYNVTCRQFARLTP